MSMVLLKMMFSSPDLLVITIESIEGVVERSSTSFEGVCLPLRID